MAGNPAALQLERCAQLVHATPLRRRYRLSSTTPLDWSLLERHLQEHLPSRGLGWRLNPAAHSIVMSRAADDSSAPLAQALPILIASLARAGARPPAAEVVRISLGKAKQTYKVRGPWRWLLVPVNLASLVLSLSFLSLAAIMSLVGVLGLMLPLAPGAPLLVLASLAVELALLLRLPFLAQPAA
jgi:hypothetical protein